MPGKGKGLVARVNIANGQRILYQKPLLTTTNISSIHAMEASIARKLKKLEKTEQRQFLSLHNNFPGKFPFGGIVKTNALPCGSGSTTGGVYPTISLINHCCLPNSHNNWNSDEEWETIHAVRDIKAGEEITISYDQGGPSDARRAHLKNAFGFDCHCRLCSLPHPDLQNSDDRRLQIQNLDSTIGDPGRVMNKPGDCLADCRRLHQVLEDEYEGHASALIARLYYDAFQISITHSDQARASIFAQRAYQSRIICEGDDSPETQQMKRFMQDPTAHRNFGVSRRWRTAKTMIPKGLDVVAFENWLWRQTS